MEPIAITGFSFKLPQGAEDENQFWELLQSGRNVMTEWPESRARIESFYRPGAHLENTLSSRGAHFIKDDPGSFDAPFFSITPKEAASMDPQQRWLLEATYLALENAGIPTEKVAGSLTAVFAASMSDDYAKLLYKDPDVMPTNSATGVNSSILANRVSWYFDLKGPSVQLNTACSSSMIAADIACQSLRNGQCSMALVAGSNVLLTPEESLKMENMGFLSPDSRCYSFDSRANGYGRGEGTIVLVLKLLRDAIADGDMIRAVVRASGTNQDGHTPGITQPSLSSQESLIRQVYKSCNLDLALTRYVEAHGTGTQLGDSTEAKALGRVFRTVRSAKEPMYIGSAKANIGHLEGASGLVGILKSVMILERGVIPPNALFEKWNTKINVQYNNIQVPTKCIPWPSAGLRRISVNSFGFGGSNGHVVLDDAFHTLEAMSANALIYTPDWSDQLVYSEPLEKRNGILSRSDTFEATESSPNHEHAGRENGSAQEASCMELGYQLLVWSAKDEAALNRMLDQHNDYYPQLARRPGRPARLLSYTLAARRSQLPWKSFAVVKDDFHPSSIQVSPSGGVRASRNPVLAFVFSGQGAQYAQMGMELMIFPVFRATMHQAANILKDLGADWSLFDEIKNADRIDSPQMSQPLCTVLQISLVELLRHLGIVAEAVVGHSSGEIAAAYTVGALSLRDACKVAYYRGLLAQELVAADSQPGAMISVNLAEAEVDAYLEKASLTGITVACINSPFNVTLSGDNDIVNAAVRHLEKDGIFCRRLNTGVAYHSPAMRAISPNYLELLSSITSGSSSPAAAFMASSVTGQKTTNMALSQGQYWVDNLVSPVQFSDAMRYLALAAPKGDGLKPITDYVEIGPHAVLKRPVTDTLRDAIKDKTFGYFSALSRFESPIEAILELVGQLCIRGHPVSVIAANQQLQKSSFLVDAPGYPFDHSQSYWHESRISRNWRLRPPVSRDLLGVPAMDWNDTEPRWRKLLRISEMPWLKDHVIGGDTLFPATGSLCMAIEAVRQMSDDKESIVGYRVKEAVFMKPIVVHPENSTEVITQVRSLREPYEKADLRFQVQIFAVLNGTWVECSKYEIHIESAESQNEVSGNQNALLAIGSQVQIDPDAKESATLPIDTGDFYQWCRNQGLNYGKTFSIAEGVCWNGDEVAVAQVPAPNELHDAIVHPAVFDAACQICYVGASNGLSRNIPTTVPHRIRDAWLAADGWQHPRTRQLRVATRSMPSPTSTGMTGTIHISSDNGLPLAYIHKFDFLPVASQAVNDDFSRNLLQQVEWKPQLSKLSLEQLRSYCVTHSSGEHEDDTEQYYLDLENALYSIISHNLNSLKQIEWNSIAPHMRGYLSSLETGLQTLQSDARKIVDEETAARTLQELSMLRPHWEVFYRVAQNLLALAHGQIDTLDLTPLASLAADFHGSLLSGFKKQLEAFLDLSAHQNSTLRILEVECDSGALTALVISILEDIEARTGGVAFCEYICTDASQANLERARARFKHHRSRLEFKVLDMKPGYDAASPELGPEGFDIVLTGGNPCSTRTVLTMIDFLRKAVKPDGHLVLCPHTHPDSFAVNFALGILPGWVRDDTKIPPVVNGNPLETVLTASEVSHEDLIINEHNFKVPYHASVIISRAGATHPSDHESPKVLLVVASGVSQQRDLGSSALDRFASLGHASHMIPLDELAETDLDATDCIVFLADFGESLLLDMPEHTFTSIKAMIQRAQNVLWVTHADTTTEANVGACSLAGIKDGFLRTLRAELPNKRIVSLSIEGSDTSPLDDSLLISAVFKSAFLDRTMEVEYIARGNQILTGRLVHDSQLSNELSSSLRPTTHFSSWLPGPPLMLDIGSRGHLDTLHYVEDTDYNLALGAKDVEIEAKAWALNFRDVFSALGRLDDAGFGIDCAGIVTRVGPECEDIQPGDRVCMCSVGCLRMYPRGDERAVVKLNPSTPFEEACALLTPGMTAWHSLATVARLQEGEKVLIHAASGATGQLAIQVAQAVKAEIFVTVGYGYKKQLLIDQYGIPEDHIFYSRSSNNTFAKDVMRMTNGYGVDVVLNSLVGEGLRASWECIAPYGRFIEIGKTDINANSKLPMGCFEKNVTFSAVDLRHILLTRVQSAGSLMHHVMRMSDQGKIRRPEPLHIYNAGNIEDAFRYVQSGKNSGRVVIQLSPETQVPKHLITRRHWEFDRESSYLVVGGFGGIGRAILDWIVSRGAMNLIVLSRSGPNSGDAAQLMHELSCRDVRVLALKCDVASKRSLRDALEECQRTLPPIRGCINAAMMINDSTFENMSHNEWNRTISSKVSTSWNLHDLLGPLDFMVFLSSISGIVGNPGQANYAGGCAFQDALARHRTRCGHKTTSIDLGVVRDVGVVAETASLKKRFDSVANGLGQIEAREVMALLDICCDPEGDLVGHPSQVLLGMETPADMLARSLEVPEIMDRPLFQYFSQAQSLHEKNGDSPDNFALMFRKAGTVEERKSIVTKSLMNNLARAIAVKPEDIESSKPLHQFGVDSLVAVELRNWIAKNFAADISVFEIMSGRTVEGVAEFVVGSSQVPMAG